MKITGIDLRNVRGYKNLGKKELSRNINIFIGSNNSGKSTILNSIFLLQREKALNVNDITIKRSEGEIELFIEGGHPPYIQVNNSSVRLYMTLKGTNRTHYFLNGSTGGFQRIPETEPYNLIYPYLSKRKSVQYNDNINEDNANSVSGNFSNLYSKIDRLVTPQFQPANKQYVDACKNILGFEISTIAKGAGKQAVYYVHNLEHIPLTAMGEGVVNIVGLIADLCVAENKIFLIEEPENDIHPKALKALLNLIIEKSTTNQFFISTHSNIVMKYLGGVKNSKVFKVSNDERDNERPNLFISKLTEIPDDSNVRREVLEDLGYDFFDFDLWKGWLFLEESSAEVLIRDYFIDWFVKPLKGKIKTFSAGGSSNIEPKFDDFNKLFVFLHLEPTYKNKVWVLIDSGEEEDKIITKMKETYSKSGWDKSNFNQFTEHDFEKYYPKRFEDKVKEVLMINEKQKRRIAKKNLLNEVKTWIAEEEETAKEEFKGSASEVIEKLKRISRVMNK